MNLTQHLLITGHVQGVWYRESMCQEAARLGVTGWVRNCTDGTVEALVSGTPEAVDALTEWARRGPPLARVESLAASLAEGEFTSFDKRDTI